MRMCAWSSPMIEGWNKISGACGERVCVREGGRERVCVCERERERESERGRERRRERERGNGGVRVGARSEIVKVNVCMLRKCGTYVCSESVDLNVL